MKERLERRITVIFGCTLALVFVIGVLQCQTVFKFVDAEHQVGQTQALLERLAATQAGINRAEDGVWGYVITGDVGYLEPYHSAVSVVPSQLRELRSLTVENPSQRKRLDALDSLVPSKLADLGKAVDAEKGEGFPAARLMIQGSGPRQLTEDIRKTFGDMQEEERQRLAQRNVAAKVIAREATFVTTVGAAVSLWLLMLAGLLIHHYIRERKRSSSAQALSTELLKGMPAGVVLSDETSMILYVNPAAEAMYGYKPGELIGHDITMLAEDIAAPDKLEVFDEIREHLDQEGAWQGEIVARKKDDTTFTCGLRVGALEVSGRRHWISLHQHLGERDVRPLR